MTSFSEPENAEPSFIFSRAVADSGTSAWMVATNAEPGEIPGTTRLFHLTSASSAVWERNDVSGWVVGLSAKPSDKEGVTLFALTDEGCVHTLTNGKIEVEDIPEAGLWKPTSRGRGALTSVRLVENHLFACGRAGQVYRRSSSGKWGRMDKGIVQAADVDIDKVLRLQDIGGPHENDLYSVMHVVRGNEMAGLVAHWEGSTWTLLDLPNVPALNVVYAEDESNVWIVGHEGALLCGNHKDGFSNLTANRSPHLFHALAVYQGEIFLASHLGLFRYDKKRGRIVKVRTDLDIEPGYMHSLESTGGVLWAVGLTDVLRFDGTRWERIDLPTWE